MKIAFNDLLLLIVASLIFLFGAGRENRTPDGLSPYCFTDSLCAMHFTDLDEPYPRAVGHVDSFLPRLLLLVRNEGFEPS